MQHKYIYVVTASTSNSEANADIEAFNNKLSANKYYKDCCDFYMRNFNYKHVYTREITTNNKYDISTTIVLSYGDNKITIKLVKIPINK